MKKKSQAKGSQKVSNFEFLQQLKDNSKVSVKKSYQKDIELKTDKVNSLLDQIIETKDNKNNISKVMNKVLDFDGLTPLEYKAHRLAREKYKNLAIAAAKESQSKQL